LTATATNAATNMAAIDPKEQFLNAFRAEVATTLKVLRAYPPGNETLQPAPASRNARDLAFIFVAEMGMLITGITTDFDWSKPTAAQQAPEHMHDIVSQLDDMQKKAVAAVQALSIENLTTTTVAFPSGPGQMANVPKLSFMWMMLCDQIHHRGQFSVYLRIAGGKLPSIYGPTADEPWHQDN
jgi:uncharacterized damage-inducible protein DinB